MLDSVPTTPHEAFTLLRSEVSGTVAVLDADRAGSPVVATVTAAGPADVVAAVRVARAHHLPVALRSTGCAGTPGPTARSGAAAGAVLIDVSALRSVSVDPAAATATVGAGATWSDVLTAALPHGLAPVAGEWSHRAAVADTLAGGMGWLARRHGLAVDRVVRYRLVTPDALTVDVTPDSQQELFWALSGCGDGALGAVTEIELELHPAGALYAGALRYPREWAAAVVDRWRAWAAAARPELTTSVVITPDAVTVHGCWAGALDLGREVVDGWRAWRRPDDDGWRVRQPGALDDVTPLALAPGSAAAAAMTCEWANTVRDELVDETVALADSGRAGVVEVRLVGGATRARSASAANHRARRDQYLITLAGLAEPSVAVRAGLAPWVTGAAFLGRCDPQERLERVRDAFDPADWQRLETVREALDPHGRFR